MDNKKPTFEQLCDPAYRRAQLITEKSGAMWTTFFELKGLINTSALSREYFGRSPGWILQRINGNTVFGKKAEFSEAEYHKFAEALRDIARRLEAHAAEIDAADMEDADN